MIGALLRLGRPLVLMAAVVLVAITSFADWSFGKSVSLAAVYILPMMLGGVVMRPHEIAISAVVCSYLRSLFETPGSPSDQVIRFTFAVLVYLVSAFFVTALVRNHQLVVQHLEQLRWEQAMRQEAEEQLRFLAESSPAAILTLASDGTVLSANRAAEVLFAIPGGESLSGRAIGSFMPVLAEALDVDLGTSELRTSAQALGVRADGEIFSAQTWFSSYGATGGRRLAAIVVDASEEMREREEEGLRHLLSGNQIAAAAIAHEVRNFCGAISLLCTNLAGRPTLMADPEVHRLAELVGGLESIARFDLRSRAADLLRPVPLKPVLDNLRIVVEPDWKEMEGSIYWSVISEIPAVLAESHGLMQVFLNLVHNSRRAVQDSSTRNLRIVVQIQGSKLTVRFEDSGPGVAAPERLFQPFQQGASGSGLGLYLSRSIIRGYGGDLRYESRPIGSCFVVELQAVAIE